VDAADVPLQRLVLQLDDGGGGRHQRVPAEVDPKLVLELIRDHRVTHYCGAPIVHSMLLNAPAEWKKGIGHEVHCLVAAAPPPAAVIEGMAKMGFDITHVYGLTETYGPAAVCAKQPEWSSLALEEQVKRNGRQGVATSSRREWP
jgi:fatty-acyl-CoA synthase